MARTCAKFLVSGVSVRQREGRYALPRIRLRSAGFRGALVRRAGIASAGAGGASGMLGAHGMPGTGLQSAAAPGRDVGVPAPVGRLLIMPDASWPLLNSAEGLRVADIIRRLSKLLMAAGGSRGVPGPRSAGSVLRSKILDAGSRGGAEEIGGRTRLGAWGEADGNRCGSGMGGRTCRGWEAGGGGSDSKASCAIGRGRAKRPALLAGTGIFVAPGAR